MYKQYLVYRTPKFLKYKQYPGSIGPPNTASTSRIRSIEPKHSENAQFKHHLASKPWVPRESPALSSQMLRVCSILRHHLEYRVFFVFRVLRVLECWRPKYLEYWDYEQYWRPKWCEYWEYERWTPSTGNAHSITGRVVNTVTRGCGLEPLTSAPRSDLTQSLVLSMDLCRGLGIPPLRSDPDFFFFCFSFQVCNFFFC